MAVDFEFKSKYNVDDLLSIMRILREPGGCPWDMEQTHESIKKNFIEETYEVVEAIDKKDKELLCEELGDVLTTRSEKSRPRCRFIGTTFLGSIRGCLQKADRASSARFRRYRGFVHGRGFK